MVVVVVLAVVQAPLCSSKSALLDTKDFFSLQDKVQILQQNCISLLKNEPIDFKLAKYCFSRSKFFQLRESNQTLGLSMQKVVNIFDKEFEEQYKKYYDE